MVGDGLERLTSAGEPDSDALVVSSGNDLAAIRRKRNPVDRARVSFEDFLKRPVGGSPNSNGSILPGRGDPGPVGGIGDAERAWLRGL